ncbi:MAG: DUF4262 domain-containing protein [Rhodospirillaceae bacterium]
MNTGAADARVRADIETFGWHCVNVHPTHGDERPGFSYTIGLTETYDHPEIMIFGLGERAHALLRECAELVKKGTTFVPDEPNGEVLASGYDVIFKRVRRECFDEYLGTALRFYNQRPFEALIMFWPTKDRRFPWELKERNPQSEALHAV